MVLNLVNYLINELNIQIISTNTMNLCIMIHLNFLAYFVYVRILQIYTINNHINLAKMLCFSSKTFI